MKQEVSPATVVIVLIVVVAIIVGLYFTLLTLSTAQNPRPGPSVDSGADVAPAVPGRPLPADTSPAESGPPSAMPG